CWAPEDMDPEPAYKMINTLFADLGQDSRLNIVFLHLRPADDPYPWRNFLNGTEMKYFYEELMRQMLANVDDESMGASYDMAHNRKQVKPKEILKNSSAFQHVMNLSNKVAAEGGRKNLGVRAEYRLTPQSDDELMDFMDDLVEQVFQHKAISKLNSAVVFALKRERNRAVAYMAKRLKEYVEPANFGAPSAEVVEANRRKAHTTQSRQQNRRQARNPVRSIRNRAQRAVTPTRTLQQQQQPVEQHTVEQQPVPGSPVVNLYPNFMPELVTIVDKANIIFRHFKHDFGNAMPRRDVTL
ncbi:hypothetical protein J3F81_003449, partial [Coemansia sp. RSA 371]